MMIRRAAILAMWLGVALWHTAIPAAHGDYYNYPCNYPFVGSSADVDVLVHGGGQYCDGPMEINGSHYHCMSGGGGIGGGAIGFATTGPISLGGLGGSGIGLGLGDCHYVCPDLTRAPWPNPPAKWVTHLVLDERYNDCRDHMTPAGAEATPQAPGSGPPAPGQPDVPAGGKLPPGRPQPAVAPQPLGPPNVTIPLPEPPSPLTPGGPLPLP